MWLQLQRVASSQNSLPALPHGTFHPPLKLKPLAAAPPLASSEKQQCSQHLARSQNSVPASKTCSIAFRNCRVARFTHPWNVPMQLQSVSTEFRNCRMAHFTPLKCPAAASARCQVTKLRVPLQLQRVARSQNSLLALPRGTFHQLHSAPKNNVLTLPGPKSPCAGSRNLFLHNISKAAWHVSPTPEMCRCSFSALPGRKTPCQVPKSVSLAFRNCCVARFTPWNVSLQLQHVARSLKLRASSQNLLLFYALYACRNCRVARTTHLSNVRLQLQRVLASSAAWHISPSPGASCWSLIPCQLLFSTLPGPKTPRQLPKAVSIAFRNCRIAHFTHPRHVGEGLTLGINSSSLGA